MSNRYITIIEDGGLNKRFKAIRMVPYVENPRDERRLLNGGRDMAYSTITTGYEYTLRVPYIPENSDYGSLDDLIEIYSRSNPNATPGVTFNLIDHYGNSHESARFLGSRASINPMTTMIDTSDNASSYTIDVQIGFQPGEAFNAPTPSSGS